MKILKKIKLRDIFVFSFAIFTLLLIIIAVLSIVSKHKEYNVFKLGNTINRLEVNHSELSKLQDQLFIYHSDEYIKDVRNYRLFEIKLKETFTLIDSILENSNIKEKTINSQINEIKDDYLIYKDYADKILDINSEIYLPEIGIKSKSNFIEKRLSNEEKFISLDLIKYIDLIKNYKSELLQEKISKREFQKKSNELIEDISKKDISEQDEYYILLFEDNLSDYYNNCLLEYSKYKTIGYDYSEGLLSKLNTENQIISKKIKNLTSKINKIRKNQLKKDIINYAIIIILIIVIMFFIFRYIYKILYIPWKKTEPHFKKISEGQLPEVEKTTTVKEISRISEYLSVTVEKLKNKNHIIEELAKRNYSVEFEVNKKDILGNSLISLKEDLIKSEKEAIQYRETEEHQKWSANGIAKIGAVMRQFTENIDDLAKNILREILEYIGAIQGVIYLHNREKGYLEQTASFSYGKQRIKEKKVSPYEGLIGTILVEKREYFYDHIPDEYIFLETGFGYGKPKSIFAFPLLFENTVYGIIEIASLEVIPEYKRNFLLNLANEIAITISYTEINIQTKELLEQSKKQAEELQSNEKLFKKNQDNLKSLLRMTEQRLSETEDSLKMKEKTLKEKIQEVINLEKEITKKEESIENITNEYENIKSSLENQNNELRRRVEELENRLRNK